MKKILNVAVAAALCGAAVIVTSATADARWGYGGWGYHGGYHGVGESAAASLARLSVQG